MTPDNHMVHGEDKILSKGDKCSCGGSWKEIDWCGELNQECDHITKVDCREVRMICHKETRLECQKCGSVVEGE